MTVMMTVLKLVVATVGKMVVSKVQQKELWMDAWLGLNMAGM